VLSKEEARTLERTVFMGKPPEKPGNVFRLFPGEIVSCFDDVSYVWTADIITLYFWWMKSLVLLVTADGFNPRK
jgi:hypothetical protein